MSADRPRHILPVVVGAQFGGTALWFAGNAVLPDMSAELHLEGSTSAITAAVQLGFIAGTALFALSGLADRFQARAVFLACCLLGAATNAATLLCTSFTAVAALRFGVGVALAGVYPIGMKAAAGWYQSGLGRALGYLVGALVLGTALPHLLGSALPWRWTLLAVSMLAATAGVTLYALVPDGPHLRRSARFDPRAVPRLARLPAFRAAALGYFGHMWELYTFWAFLPALIALEGSLPTRGTAFTVIAAGSVGCVVGGLLVPRFGGRRVAGVQLAISGACCLALPLALELPGPLFLAFLVVWGVTVVGDSPQYSALSAQAAPPDLVGTGLTLVTSVGFGLTVVSVGLAERFESLPLALTALAVGPALGLVGLTRGAGTEPATVG